MLLAAMTTRMPTLNEERQLHLFERDETLVATSTAALSFHSDEQEKFTFLSKLFWVGEMSVCPPASVLDESDRLHFPHDFALFEP